MLDGDNCHQAVTDVLTVKILVLVLQDAELSCIGIHNAGKRGLETGDKRTAVYDVNAVTVGVNLLGEGAGVLKCDLHFDVALGTLNVNRFGMKRNLFAAKV